MMGLQSDWGRFWIYVLDMVLVTNTGVAFLLFVGSVSPIASWAFGGWCVGLRDRLRAHMPTGVLSDR